MKSVKIILTLVCISLIVLLLTERVDAAVGVEDASAIWLFDEGVGKTVKDYSGNGNDGEINGPKWVEGKFGKGLEFSTSQSVKSSTAKGVGKTYISETLWVNFNDFASEQQFGYIRCSGTASPRFLKNIGVFASPSITNITDNSSSYTNSEIPKYKKFEISFDIDSTTATNFQLPYDPTPPSGITAGVGITVDGLFLPPGETNWDSAKVQPGFWYENFTMDQNDAAHTGGDFPNSPDWIYAEGKEQWKIRFAPTQTGQWKYKIRVIDASGQTESSEMTFNVVPSTSKGFIRVSQTDRRYFEFDNGEVFIPAGLSLMTQGIAWGISQGILSRLWNNPWQNKAVENKLNLFRPWFTAWQEMPIYGGYGSTRSSYFRFLKLVLNSSDTTYYGEPQGVHSGKYAYKKSVDDVKSCDYCYDYGARAFLNTSFILRQQQVI